MSENYIRWRNERSIYINNHDKPDHVLRLIDSLSIKSFSTDMIDYYYVWQINNDSGRFACKTVCLVYQTAYHRSIIIYLFLFFPPPRPRSFTRSSPLREQRG